MWTEIPQLKLLYYCRWNSLMWLREILGKRQEGSEFIWLPNSKENSQLKTFYLFDQKDGFPNTNGNNAVNSRKAKSVKGWESFYGEIRSIVSPGIRNWRTYAQFVKLALMRKSTTHSLVASIVVLVRDNRSIDLGQTRSWNNKHPTEFASQLTSVSDFHIYGAVLIYVPWESRNKRRFGDKTIYNTDDLNRVKKKKTSKDSH